MSIIRWQRPGFASGPSFGTLFGLRDELHRLIEHPLGEIARGRQLLRVWNPALDLYEDKDNVFVKVELAGLKKEDIDVSLEDGVLTISGERKSETKAEDAETHRSERFVGHFNRIVTLPSEVKADEVKAVYQDGILTVTLPKAEAAKPKQIEVKID
jgi:HSP20 family protein